MEKLFENKHAEEAPEVHENVCWYFFGVQHPQTLGQIWVVFYMSAQEGGIFLNNILLSDSDLNSPSLKYC